MMPAAPPHVRPEQEGGPRRARLLMGLGLALLGLWTLHGFLPALAWGGILAIATWPLYRRTRQRWPRHGHDILWPALFTAAIALLVLLPLGLMAIQAGREAGSLLAWLQQAERSGLPVPAWIATLPFGAAQASAWWQETLADPGGAGELLARLNGPEVLSLGRQLGADLLHRAVLFGFAILTLFFLFRDGDRLAAQLLHLARRSFGPSGERVARQMVASVHGTVDGLVLVGLGEGALLGIAYAVAGVPHPTLLGALTALAAMIPFGAPLVFGAAALVLLAQGAATAAAAIFGFGMVVVFVADHAVRPALIGGATRLPFLLVLLGILGGVETWGLLGLFLGPAIMAALVLLWEEWTAAH
ncbi:AI-2E family transporter [Paracraurococcus lichenis]|uniref:AI-2E family transporter n=1 Tax=Paracraurococcus lichenis TaxID=3064888 RepID=A0ABT9E559_9PROT|nr:AI-2E family transporter [Paracraurococcus sp. LOR1-02]MDO9711298.1 AI-2E family transporter [Paracraurococcus sp. LOR1-02]